MTSVKEFYLVGIGASAGGLEAIEAFFSTVKADSGLAYVIIQHLSPDYISLMPEILSKRTSLNVHTAKDGMKVEPNNIYLIPRKTNMKIFHSKLHLTEKTITQHLNLPIDIFLNSLAEDFEDKAIAVILSGTGSDGSRGIRMVKENGGIVFAQDPDSSKFDGMPKSAITTGTVDFILPPQKMPDKIIGYVKHPYIQEKDRNSELSLVPGDYMSKIIMILKDSSGLDFTYYKDTTISRRIERRLSINQIDNLKDYLEYLTTSKNEQRILYKELLIGVTKFFRDPEAFEIIENEIIPGIFEQKSPKDEIRIWVSACSTGEEAYSVAILFKEYMLANNLENDVKIFATDIDKSAIEFSSAGIYSAGISADISSQRLNNFFTQQGENFKITDNIREMIVFANQNVIKDPPFNKIDFLTCRNLLIYFQSPLQQKVLSVFNFALNKNGYMFLGNSETIGEMESFFEIINHKWKIYKSLRTGKLHPDNYQTSFPGNIAQATPLKRPVFTMKNSAADLASIFTEKILSDNAPTTVVVNENYRVINSFGNLNELLSLPNINKISEGFDFDITKMVPSNLKLTFSIAINKAIKSQEDIYHYNIKYLKPEKETQLVDLVFSPLKRNDLNTKFVVIYFIKKEKLNTLSEKTESYEDIDEQIQQRILDLENELKHSRENLQASIEELETTNEELQSTNEELQSVNEELYTVNTEFQAKNHDLVVMNNDMENLLQNTDVLIVFLDLELKIRKFTDNITKIFNLKINDQNRPISDITHKISGVDLTDEIAPVLNEQKNVYKIVEANNKWYEMKIMPYLTRKGFIEGIVISFVDVSNFYHSQIELKESQEKLQLLFDFIPMGLTIADKDGNILTSNKAAEKLLHIDKDKQSKRKIDGEEWRIIRKDGSTMPPEEFASVRAMKENQAIKHVEMGILSPDNKVTWINVNAAPTHIEGFDLAISYTDITHIVENEEELKRSNNLYRALFHNMTNGFALHEIITNENNIPVDYRFLDVNKRFEEITGLSKANILNKTIKEVIPEIEDYWIQQYGKVALSGKSTSFEYEVKALNKNLRVNAFSPQKNQFVAIFDEI